MTVWAVDVAIIGAGTAGLSARAEVAKRTDSYMVFDPGPYGTTCARTACMPSKAFLQSAHDFHRRRTFDDLGITGAEHLRADGAGVLGATRKIRDRLVEGVKQGMEDWRQTHLVQCAPRFSADGSLQADDTSYLARATIVATGSRPVVPQDWYDRFGERILTTDDFFELENLPRRIAVVGLGAAGLELGQAMARLGVEVMGFDPSATIGGLADPVLQDRLRESLDAEMVIVRAQVDLSEGKDGAIKVQWDEGEAEVDCVLAAMGRKPELGDLGLSHLGIDLAEDGLPDLSQGQLNPPGTRVYFAGDSGRGPALLHEASDEGHVAGYFAARDQDALFRRRVPLAIVFCEPQIALAGATWDELEARGEEIVIGEASFDRAGRIQLQRESGGALRVYAERATARLLGAAILAPEAEHLGHLIASAIEHEDDLSALLRMPAYHPTHEEVLRRALRATLKKCDVDVPEIELVRCKETPVDCDEG
ncbi:dihydrolipoyl dehydrogenase [Defluviimonas sp. WL0002]|uniref:Dihydrolipoyl dehydrogenase n=1 Tax=Albidovulum marisflavi TaxID=2984159 RepID=A0ABT2ZBF6_9RHOB|nr:dihydrolipoyl dehydrogenase [Defluviimonas sp. WL0002]MCV2868436.1 dihydrolipoyl dehydrogenase [Defluviimonas sp. WL0002]